MKMTSFGFWYRSAKQSEFFVGTLRDERLDAHMLR
jgi:hypothetical protein